MAEGTSGSRRFSDKWGKHELDVLAVLSSAFPQWLTSRQIAQRVKAYADSYGESWQIRPPRPRSPSSSSVTAPSSPLWESPSNHGSLIFVQVRRTGLRVLPTAVGRRTAHPSDVRAGRSAGACRRQLSGSFDFVSSDPNRRPSPNMRRAPRRVCRRPLFPVSVWIRLRLAWARSPFRTRWSRLSIRVALPPPLMWTANT